MTMNTNEYKMDEILSEFPVDETAEIMTMSLMVLVIQGHRWMKLERAFACAAMRLARRL